MCIQLTGVSKKYVNNWLFKNINFQFDYNTKYSIEGFNGSGKSTLLQIISGFLSCERGAILYEDKLKRKIETSQIHEEISYCAPYISIMDSMTLREALDFHFVFKKGLESTNNIIREIGFSNKEDTPLKNFSSGMKQKLKLALAFYSKTSIILLDEPCMNLDYENIEWYKTMIQNFSQDRIVIIASNSNKDEIGFCTQSLRLEDFK